ncbi:hypothetical protein TH0335_02650 [Helicobacter pylori]
MRNYVGADPFILIVKNAQRHQFDYQYSIKNFYKLYKMRWNVLRGVIFNHQPLYFKDFCVTRP